MQSGNARLSKLEKTVVFPIDHVTLSCLSHDCASLNMADREEHRSLLDEDEEDEGSRHLSPLCDPRHLLHRILVLVFMCFLGFGKKKNTINPDDESQDTHHPHIHIHIALYSHDFVSFTLRVPWSYSVVTMFGLSGVRFHVKVKLNVFTVLLSLLQAVTSVMIIQLRFRLKSYRCVWI